MSRLTEIGPLQTEDNILSLAWSEDGEMLAVTPSTGEIHVVGKQGRLISKAPGHGLGNGESAWFSGDLATCGFDGKISCGERVFVTGRGLIERVVTSPDGRHLAAGQGRLLHVFDASGNASQSLKDLPTAVADLAWNPSAPNEIAIVGGGGARMWRLGESEPYARFDWGGASLRVLWSSCGRWLATADQTPSVHVYDFSRDYPLHIQGYETKVRAMAFSADGKKLATGGSPVVTIWPTTGPTGPEGVTPVQLDGHDSDVIAASFSPSTGQLATGDDTGALLLFTFSENQALRKRVRREAGVSALSWHPTLPLLAVGQSDGRISLIELS